MPHSGNQGEKNPYRRAEIGTGGSDSTSPKIRTIGNSIRYRFDMPIATFI